MLGTNMEVRDILPYHSTTPDRNIGTPDFLTKITRTRRKKSYFKFCIIILEVMVIIPYPIQLQIGA